MKLSGAFLLVLGFGTPVLADEPVTLSFDGTVAGGWLDLRSVTSRGYGYNGPVIVIRADDDKLVDDESCKRYAGLYQAAEFVRVSGGGHNFATIPSRTACEQAIWKFIQDNL